MKILARLLLILFLILTSGQLFSQIKQPSDIKQSFIPLLDSLIVPPADCKAAFNLMTFDSSRSELVYISSLEDQITRVDELFTEITSLYEKNKIERSGIPRNPNGNGPPQGGVPPGGMGPPGGIGKFPDELSDLKDDMSDATTASDRIIVAREKLKNELIEMSGNTNEELHKTLATDHAMHINIVNLLLKSGSEKYDKNFRLIRENMIKIDDIIKKYDYGSKIKFPPLKAEILNLQLEQITNIKFLLNITKEFVNIGAKIYNEQ